MHEHAGRDPCADGGADHSANRGTVFGRPDHGANDGANGFGSGFGFNGSVRFGLFGTHGVRF